MALDINKLQMVRHLGNGSIQARCPACAESGGDRSGLHLRIYADGRYGCVVNPGKDGELHRRRIFALAGLPVTPKEWTPKPVQRAKVASVSIRSALGIKTNL